MQPEYHRVRASAFAACGDLDKARDEARKALDLARSQKAEMLVKRAQSLIEELGT